MFDGLAKADPHVEHDLLRAYSILAQTAQTIFKKVLHGQSHILILRIPLHGLRVALHMQYDITRATLRHPTPHFRVLAVGPDVVDHAGAGIKGGPGNGRFDGVDRNRFIALWHELLDDGQHAIQFFFFGDSRRAWPRGFAADVNDIGTFGSEFQREIHRGGCILESSAIREGIRRDINDPHDERGSGKAVTKLPGAQDHLLTICLAASTKRRAIAPTSSSGTPICGLADWLSIWH